MKFYIDVLSHWGYNWTAADGRQAEADLPVICKRMASKQIAVEHVDGEGAVALLRQIDPAGSDGEGDAA